MYKLLSTLCLFLLAGSLSAQKLTGVVYDKTNQEPVAGAHVYIEGSSLYDVTDSDGKFEIRVNSVVNLPLIISHISYQTQTVNDPFRALPDTVFVDEKENLLGEVVVQAGRYSRNQLMRAFRREFLGTSTAARSCIIENEEMIDVWFNSQTHILSAACEAPICIHNRHLGYKLYVTVDRFEVEYPGRQLGVGTPLLIDYKGATFFEDIAPSAAKNISDRRNNTFKGSPSHFLRALLNDELEKNNYLLFKQEEEGVMDASACFTVTPMRGQQQIAVNPQLASEEITTWHGMNYYGAISVQRGQNEVTELIFFQDAFTIDAWGTPTKDILFVGYMGRLGFGDMLPADYGIDLSKPTETIVWDENMTVGERLNYFMELTPTEKIYIHQDRTRYVAGETVWFKAYQEFSNSNETGSSILYVDLQNAASELVVTSKWPIEDGMAYGQIELPDTLPSGNYQLTAYTRYMQNPGMENYFTREIQVFSAYYAEVTEENRQTPEPSTKLRFYPEGGQLVEGITSKVAFQVTDQCGKGLEASGVITDQDGNEAGRFRTQHDGMGVFTFEPQPDRSYMAQLDNFSVETDFPQVQAQGVVMEMQYNINWIRITIRHNLHIGFGQSPFYLTVHQNGEDYYTTSVDVTKPECVLNIPVEYLPEGIFTITIYDKQLHAWCERLAFINYPEPLQLQLTTDQETVEKRKKVTVDITATDRSGLLQSGNFSLAVVGSDLDGTAQRNNYYSDYFLQSELKGNIENPASYFEEKDSTGLQNIDLLMLTRGWRKYAWDDMMVMLRPERLYQAEKSLGFAGKVELGRRMTSDQVTVTALLRLDEINEFLFGQLEEDGSFRFTGYHFSDTAEVLLSAVDNKNSALKMAVDRPFSLPLPDYLTAGHVTFNDLQRVEVFGSMPLISGDMENTIFELPEVWVTARAVRRNRNQIHRSEHSLAVFEVTPDLTYAPVSLSMPQGTDSDNAGRGDNTGALSLLDNIPGLRVMNEGRSGRIGSPVDPVYVLNGKRVSADVLRSIPPGMISRVEVLAPAAAMVYGSGSLDGAFAFFTKDPLAINSVRLMPSQTVSFRFAGYNQEKEFYSPDYSFPPTIYRPDYRKTLYWQPEVVLDQDGKASFSFFTSDDTGEYTIHCEGISTAHEIGVGQCRFRVF